jgi:hypothetical protein
MALRTEGLFSKDLLADQIAIYAIYLPLLRKEVREFVTTWNNHRIRSQNGRTTTIAGKPFMLYEYPPEGTHDYRVSVEPDVYRTVADSIRRVFEWDIEAYLSSETLEICNSFFNGIDFDISTVRLETPDDRANPLIQVYRQLRTMLQTHIDGGLVPQLGLASVPAGSYEWAMPQGSDIDTIQLPMDET